jgi:transcriptional regulator with XRE-family HTH domain
MKDMKDQWESQMEALGAFIRNRRKLANLSLRQLAERTRLSNPYLSQIERGLHQPSVRVIRLIADALNVSAETLLIQAGLLQGNDWAEATARPQTVGVPQAIEAENRLTEQQKAALLAVYHSMLKSD